jgi:predicted acylesterase/phospholipase RssA
MSESQTASKPVDTAEHHWEDHARKKLEDIAKKTPEDIANEIGELKKPDTYRLIESTSAPECDLVMKGGVTSGIVYPLAVCELARKYRFRRIGGTSAGAISAAATAAAELGRWTGKNEGFAKFANLPFELGETVGTSTKLESLFQPQPETQRLFTALLTLNDNNASILQKLLMLLRLWPSMLLPFLAGVVATLVMMVCGTVFGVQVWPLIEPVIYGLLLVAVLTILVLCLKQQPVIDTVGLATVPLVFAVLIRMVLILNPPTMLLLTLFTVSGLVLLLVLVYWAWHGPRGLQAELNRYVNNDYGLCHGTSPSGQGTGTPGLTDWLGEYLNTLAGKEPGGPPLTFGELWDGNIKTTPLEPPANSTTDEQTPSDPSPETHLKDDPAKHIDLRVITTCLTHGRPYTFPNDEKDLYFIPAELERFFCPAVIKHMKAHARPSKTVTKIKEENKGDYLALPVARDLPVIFAVRMSLSFPALFSMVPLHGKDYRSKRNLKRARITDLDKLWFTDGGISSNFPVHLFDDPLPARPNFALNLRSPAPSESVPDLRWKPGFSRFKLDVMFDPNSWGQAHDRYEKYLKQSRLVSVFNRDLMRFPALSDAQTDQAALHERDAQDPVVQAADWWWRIGQELDEAKARSNPLPTTKRTPLAHVLDAFTQIFESARNWQDTTTMRLPGFNDRIAHVMLEDWEGGLNLKMPLPVIAGVAIRGWWAGYKLRQLFNFEDHQQLRGGLTAIMYADWIKRLEHVWDQQSGQYAGLFQKPYIQYTRGGHGSPQGKTTVHAGVMNQLTGLFDGLVNDNSMNVKQSARWGKAIHDLNNISDFANPPDLKTRARY